METHISKGLIICFTGVALMGAVGVAEAGGRDLVFLVALILCCVGMLIAMFGDMRKNIRALLKLIRSKRA
jgi:hypothetical protein